MTTIMFITYLVTIMSFCRQIYPSSSRASQNYHQHITLSPTSLWRFCWYDPLLQNGKSHAINADVIPIMFKLIKSWFLAIFSVSQKIFLNELFRFFFDGLYFFVIERIVRESIVPVYQRETFQTLKKGMNNKNLSENIKSFWKGRNKFQQMKYRF